MKGLTYPRGEYGHLRPYGKKLFWHRQRRQFHLEDGALLSDENRRVRHVGRKTKREHKRYGVQYRLEWWPHIFGGCNTLWRNWYATKRDRDNAMRSLIKKGSRDVEVISR